MKAKANSQYRKNEWVEFRNSVIELDGNECNRCGRPAGEVILQVHHKFYIPGRKLWEYATQDCETLCKGCHAAEHGLIRPNHGWEYCGQEDLGDLIGTCERCDNSIRHVFTIQHPDWGTMEVGTYCCDLLTDSNVASNFMESEASYKGRKTRFMTSSRWKAVDGFYKIKQGLFSIEIKPKSGLYFITIQQLESKKEYVSLKEAKSKAFDVIESGELINYLKRKGISIDDDSSKRAIKNH